MYKKPQQQKKVKDWRTEEIEWETLDKLEPSRKL